MKKLLNLGLMAVFMVSMFAIAPQKADAKMAKPDYVSITSKYNKATTAPVIQFHYFKKKSQVTGYKIYRSTNKKSYKLIKTIKAKYSGSWTKSWNSYKDKNFVINKVNYYKVKAYKGGSASGFSKVVSIDKRLQKPRNVSIDNVPEASSPAGSAIKVSWYYPDYAYPSHVQVYRSANGGEYSKVATIKTSSSKYTKITWTDKKLDGGNTYKYKVRSYIKKGKKAYVGKFVATNSFKTFTGKGLSSETTLVNGVNTKATITKFEDNTYTNSNGTVSYSYRLYFDAELNRVSTSKSNTAYVHFFDTNNNRIGYTTVSLTGVSSATKKDNVFSIPNDFESGFKGISKIVISNSSTSY